MTENVGSDDVINKTSRSETNQCWRVGQRKHGFPYNLFIILVEEYKLRELTVVQILLVWQETKTRSSSKVILPKDHGNLRQLIKS